jgi:hypothetical protein
MMRIFIHALATMSLILTMNTSAFGSEIEVEVKREIHPEHAKSLSQHIHGKAELQIVLEDKQLSVELNSPAMNLLGFEHGIHNSEDQIIVENTRTSLTTPSALFLLSDGECMLEQQSADFSGLLITNKNVQPNHEHHKSHKQDSNSHNDIKATYLYHCAQPEKLHSAMILLLDIFPNIISLQVQWIIHNQQGMAIVDDEHNEIHFR